LVRIGWVGDGWMGCLGEQGKMEGLVTGGVE